MKDSLFDDKPVVKRFENKQFKLTPKANQEPIATFSIKTPKKSNDLDNLIDQLNDVIGG